MLTDGKAAYKEWSILKFLINFEGVKPPAINELIDTPAAVQIMQDTTIEEFLQAEGAGLKRLQRVLGQKAIIQIKSLEKKARALDEGLNLAWIFMVATEALYEIEAIKNDYPELKQQFKGIKQKLQFVETKGAFVLGELQEKVDELDALLSQAPYK